MKISVYELLGMVKNGKAPKRIIFDTEIYNWCEEQEEYRRYPYNNELYKNLNSDYDISKCLNDEVEILEEEKKIPEKLNWKPKESMAGQLTQKEQIEVIARRTEKLKKEFNEILDFLKQN